MYKGTNLKEIQQKYQEFMTDLFNEKIGISVEGLSNKERKTYMRLKKCYIDWVLHDAYSGGYPFSISGDIRSVPS